jgi:hypothetical protein
MANRRFIDFPIAASVGDNDIVLIWQDGLNKQTTKATLLQGSPQSLAGLTDVDIAGLTNGQILQYNSTLGKWENVDRTDINLSELGDVTIVAPTNGQVLVYNSSTSKWENSSGGYVPYTGAVTTVNLGAQSILAGTFVKAGGTSAQFLKADGSVDSTAYGTGSVTSVGLTMPSAFNVANSPVTTAGTLAVTGAGTVAQYIRGDGSLADFPATTGGGASVSYYLNGSVSQGTIGGVAYREVNRNPVFGTGTDITRNSDGYIASFITDAGDPNKLEIPAGNWNLETYFSASSGGGNPSFYVELYKYNGSTFTLIASSATSPELIAFGTNLNPYFSTLAVPQTTLTLTDRLALRYYVNTSGRTITLHTENNHLCQVITTFTTGLTALNGLTTQVQFFAVGTSGTDFAISSATDTHTFNLPTASATNRGALSSADWSTFNAKMPAITFNSPLFIASGGEVGITQASGSTNGFLSSTDWTTFNNKQNALTNPVTGTGASGRVAYFTGSTSIGGEDALFWDSTNNRLGIGTTIPTNPLHIVSNEISQLNIQALSGNTNAQINLEPTGTGIALIGPANNVDFAFRTNATIQMRLTNTGNLGLGVTPSAWGTDFRAIQIGAAGGTSIASDDWNGFTEVLNNVFASSRNTYTRIQSLGAARYSQQFGTHAWYSVGAGSGGTTVSFTQAMTLTNANLLVGTTTDSGFKLDVNGTGRFSGQLTGNSWFNVANTFGLTIRNAANTAFRTAVQMNSSNVLIFGQDSDITALTFGVGSEAMRITSGGNVGIGTTTDVGVKLNIRGSSATNLYLESTGASVYQQFVNSGGSAYIGTTSNDLLFLTTSAGNERMRITSGGRVGIGTTSPNVALHISGINEASGFDITNTTASTGKTFRFASQAAGNLVFEDITAGATRMAITSGGNVLIGTTTNGASKLRLVGLPTSSVGLSSGDVYNLSGVLMIA